MCSMRYFTVFVFICLVSAGCTNLRNDPAIQEWKDFNTRILMSDAISGTTWEISKLFEIRQDILYTDFIISMSSKKSESQLDKILQTTSLRSREISKVIYFLKDKGIDKDVIKRYELVLSINKRTLNTAKLIAVILNKIESGNRIDATRQKELDSLKMQLTASRTKIDRIIVRWLKSGQSNPDTLIRKTFPEFFKSSIRAYGSHKFYKTVDSYIENGELVIDKIIKIKKNTGRWARKNEIKFNNWQYSEKRDSFVLRRSIDLLGPNKFILQYVYGPTKQNGWYLEFLEIRKSAFMKKSPAIENMSQNNFK